MDKTKQQAIQAGKQKKEAVAKMTLDQTAAKAPSTALKAPSTAPRNQNTPERRVISVPVSAVLNDTSNALYRIPVFLSYATPYNSLQSQFLDRVIAEIRSALLFPRTLGRSDQYTETPLTSIRKMVNSSYGLIAFAFRRAFVDRATSRPGAPNEQTFENFWLTSPYLQIEPSMAYQQGLPVALFVEDGVSTNGVFGGVLQLGAAPLNVVTFNLTNEQSITDFFNSVFWKETFNDWAGDVRACYNKRTQPVNKCGC